VVGTSCYYVTSQGDAELAMPIIARLTPKPKILLIKTHQCLEDVETVLKKNRDVIGDVDLHAMPILTVRRDPVATLLSLYCYERTFVPTTRHLSFSQFVQTRDIFYGGRWGDRIDTLFGFYAAWKIASENRNVLVFDFANPVPGSAELLRLASNWGLTLRPKIRVPTKAGRLARALGARLGRRGVSTAILPMATQPATAEEVSIVKALIASKIHQENFRSV